MNYLYFLKKKKKIIIVNLFFNIIILVFKNNNIKIFIINRNIIYNYLKCHGNLIKRTKSII